MGAPINIGVRAATMRSRWSQIEGGRSGSGMWISYYCLNRDLPVDCPEEAACERPESGSR